MRDLRRDLPDDTEPESRHDHRTGTDGDLLTGDLLTDDHGDRPTDPDMDAEPSGRPRRRRAGLWIMCTLLAVVVLTGAAAGVLHWRGELEPLVQAISYRIDPPPAATVTASPARGTTKVGLDETVTVEATGGVLTDVRATTADGVRLRGKRSADGRSWQSTVPLAPDTAYEVTWTAENPAEAATRGSTTFRTLTPERTLEADVVPIAGRTYGVGQPLVVRFNHPVSNKADVEAALDVRNSEGVGGAWRWFGDEEVRYRPAEYWPAHSSVTLNVDLTGVDAGDGTWGVKGRTVSFDIGRRQVSVVNAETHQMTVEVDGEAVRTMPVSTGRPEFATRNGVHTVLTRERVHTMDSATIGMPGEYLIDAEYALRLTNTGEFVHSAPWSVAAQGNANVSHGCINLGPEDAAWFFEQSQIGDVVEVVGSTAEPEETEGMIEWNRSFAEWKQGSALASRAGRTPS